MGGERSRGEVPIGQVSQDKVQGVLTVSGEFNDLREAKLAGDVTSIKFVKIPTQHKFGIGVPIPQIIHCGDEVMNQ